MGPQVHPKTGLHALARQADAGQAPGEREIIDSSSPRMAGGAR